MLELDINTKLVQNIKLAKVATSIGTENDIESSLPLIGKEIESVLAIIKEGLKNSPSLPNYKNL